MGRAEASLSTRGAFTLTEMLVVIGISATLAALLFPVFTKAKRAAVVTRSIEAMRQTHRAALIYQLDYESSSYNLGLPASTWGMEPWDLMGISRLVRQNCDFSTPIPPNRTGLYWNVYPFPHMRGEAEDLTRQYVEKPNTTPMVLDVTCNDSDVYDTDPYRHKWSFAVSMNGNLLRSYRAGNPIVSEFYE